jgi:membrane protein
MAVLFRYATDRDEPEWVWVSPDAVFTVITWTVSSIGFGVYVSNFGSYNETYGSLGAIVVVLLWLFISATVVLIGAEFNAEIERQTAVDSTTGPDGPTGRRDADAADSDSVN